MRNLTTITYAEAVRICTKILMVIGMGMLLFVLLVYLSLLTAFGIYLLLVPHAIFKGVLSIGIGWLNGYVALHVFKGLIYVLLDVPRKVQDGSGLEGDSKGDISK